MGHYDNCRDDHFPDAGKMVEPLNTKPLAAADLVEMIAHKEQIGIWANEIATAISLGDMLKEDWSFDDSVDLEREIVAQLRDVLSSAFSHPAYDIATLITTQQQEIERLTSRNAVLDADGIAARKGAANNYAHASAAESRVLSLEEEVKRLREALKPFVNVRDQHPESVKLINGSLDGFTIIEVKVTKDQFLTAHAALKENGNG